MRIHADGVELLFGDLPSHLLSSGVLPGSSGAVLLSSGAALVSDRTF